MHLRNLDALTKFVAPYTTELRPAARDRGPLSVSVHRLPENIDLVEAREPPCGRKAGISGVIVSL